MGLNKALLFPYSPGNYKRTVGNPDGLKENVKMGLSGILVATGRPGRWLIGMAAQISLVRSIKISSAPLKDPDVLEGITFENLLLFYLHYALLTLPLPSYYETTD